MSVVPLLAGQLELRISAHSVGSYPRPATKIDSALLAAEAMAPSTDVATTSNGNVVRLLSGPLDDFLEYARLEHSKWLIDIAHDICDPATKRGSLLVWTESAQEWRRVTPTDALTASIYRYDLPAGIVVGLSKISAHTGKSKTSVTGNASTMADRVKFRDGTMCWVTGSPEPLTNSHICPKRVGDHLASLIFHTFASPLTPTPTLSVYDTVFGLCLLDTLDTWFDLYQLGFRYMAPYECHDFAGVLPATHMRTTVGVFPVSTIYSRLHGSRASPPNPDANSIPPPGLFRWQYLQCVIRKFAHSDYKQLENIAYPELPLRMEGDSDDEGTDSEAEWPSKALDCGRALQAEEEHSEQRERFVADWIGTT